MKMYYCITHDAGSWTEDALGSNDKPIVETHRKLGCKVVEENDKPKLRGKENWGKTEIEKLFTNYMIENYDRMLCEVIEYHKTGVKQ